MLVSCLLQTELNIVKENTTNSRQEAPNNNSKPPTPAPAVTVHRHGMPTQAAMTHMQGYEHANQISGMPPIVQQTAYPVYPQGFDPNAFLFPFNMGQMGFQSPEPQALSQQMSQQITQQFSQQISPNYSHMIPPMMENAKKKPIILDQTQERFIGRLKFFDEQKGYGFIVKEDDEKDIFCHLDDFAKAGITINLLRSVKLGQTLKLSFSCLSYIGRHNKSKKAVDLQLITIISNPAMALASNMGGLVGLTPMAFPGLTTLPTSALPDVTWSGRY